MFWKFPLGRINFYNNLTIIVYGVFFNHVKCLFKLYFEGLCMSIISTFGYKWGLCPLTPPRLLCPSWQFILAPPLVTNTNSTPQMHKSLTEQDSWQSINISSEYYSYFMDLYTLYNRTYWIMQFTSSICFLTCAICPSNSDVSVADSRGVSLRLPNSSCVRCRSDCSLDLSSKACVA